MPQNGCPFPQAVTILPLFPLKQPIEKPTLFARRRGLKKKSPRAWGRGPPEAGLERVGVSKGNTELPQEGQQVDLGSGLDPEHTARCPRVGEVEK